MKPLPREFLCLRLLMHHQQRRQPSMSHGQHDSLMALEKELAMRSAPHGDLWDQDSACLAFKSNTVVVFDAGAWRG